MGGRTSSIRSNIAATQQSTTVQTTVVSGYKFNNDTTNEGKPLKVTKLKVLIVGAPRVGKSALVRRLLHNTFSEALSSYIPTSKVDLSIKNIIQNEKVIELEIWDTPSHPDLRDFMLDQYFHSADIVVFVGDVTKPASFRDIQAVLLPALRQYCRYHYSDRMPVTMLLANKNDKQYTGPHTPGSEVKVTHDACVAMGESMQMNVINLISCAKDWLIEESFEKAVSLALSVPRRVWQPISQEVLYREQLEEEERLKALEAQEAERARMAEEEEKELQKLERDLLIAEGLHVDTTGGDGDSGNQQPLDSALRSPDVKSRRQSGVVTFSDQVMEQVVTDETGATSTVVQKPSQTIMSENDRAQVMEEDDDDDVYEASGDNILNQTQILDTHVSGTSAVVHDDEFDDDDDGEGEGEVVNDDEFDDNDEFDDEEEEEDATATAAVVNDDEFDDDNGDGNADDTAASPVQAEEEEEPVAAAVVQDDEFDDVAPADAADGAADGAAEEHDGVPPAEPINPDAFDDADEVPNAELINPEEFDRPDQHILVEPVPADEEFDDDAPEAPTQHTEHTEEPKVSSSSALDTSTAEQPVVTADEFDDAPATTTEPINQEEFD